MHAPLKRVVMRAPGAILSADAETWHYAKPIDPDRLNAQYRHFVGLVEAAGAEVVWIDDSPPVGSGPAMTVNDGLADSVFTYDPSFVIADGAIVLRPGKDLRVDEARLHADFYRRTGVPILGHIEEPGTVEGGDVFWLDNTTLAVGRGFRTNQPGIDQLADIVADHGLELFAVDLPYFQGPEACLHLLSVISPLDDDLALIHAPLLPTSLYQRLVDLGYELLIAPPEEFGASAGLSLNVLATGPRQCIAIEGFPGTLNLLREAGCEVATFAADELCIPCEGGPTCLTRPLLRA
ncbi:MAG: arginine deiminase family protein, partial [Acidimicrobiia bacterium]|nr:arginine deiminase family protein [Acidimicrobiia bacterium]